MLEIFPKRASKQNVINLHLKQLPPVFQFLEHRSSFFCFPSLWQVQGQNSGCCHGTLDIRQEGFGLRKGSHPQESQRNLSQRNWKASSHLATQHPGNKFHPIRDAPLDDRTALVVTWHRRVTRKPNAAKHVAALTLWVILWRERLQCGEEWGVG